MTGYMSNRGAGMNIIGIDPAPPEGKVGIVWWDNCRIVGQTVSGSPDVFLEELEQTIELGDDELRIVVEGIQSYGRVIGASVIETAYLVGDIRMMARYTKTPFHIVTKPTHAAATSGMANPTAKELATSLDNRFGRDVLRKAGVKNPHTRNALSCAVWLAKGEGLLTDA